MEYISKNEKDTINIAKEFAKTLSVGDVVTLEGDLGAGKTVFTKGIVDFFSGGKQIAISPTFTIVNEYQTNPKLYHFDFYRINSPKELFAIGVEEYLYGDGICIVEWPERAPEVFDGMNIKKVVIEKNGENRKICF